MECATCGATMVFDPGGQVLACTKCDATAPLRTTPGLVTPLVYESVAESVAADEAESVRLDCPGCGATNDHPDNAWAGSCAYCRLPFVGNPTSTRTLLPAGVLPLAISAADASTAVRDWLGTRWFAPRKLKAVSDVRRLSGTYSPIWAFDLQVTARYEGRRGDDYQTTETHTTTNADGTTSTSTSTVTHTRWRSVDGTVEERFRDVVTFAAHDALERHGAELAPWGLAEAVPYADDYLRGTQASAYTRNVVAGFQAAAHQTEDPVADLVREDIGGDHQDIRRIDPRYHHVMVRYLLLPAWLAVYGFGGRSYEVVVNGRTGTVAGTRPVSKAKVAALVLAVVALLAILAFVLARRSPPSAPVPTTRRPAATSTVPTGPTTSVPPSAPSNPSTPGAPSTAVVPTSVTVPGAASAPVATTAEPSSPAVSTTVPVTAP